MACLLLGGAGYGGYSLLQVLGPPPDYSGSGTGSVKIEVKRGQTIAEIGQELEREGVVKSAEAFVAAATSHDEAKSLQPGFYRLRHKMAASKALALLLDPSSQVRMQVTIPEGLQMSQIFKKIAENSDISAEELRQAAKNPEDLGLPSYAETGVEGYLYPATYSIPPGTSATEILQRMVERFQQEAKKINLVERAQAVNLTPHEAVTVASLAQAEGRDGEEFRKVTRVVYNRLQQGMKLGLDSTVNYATGNSGIWVSRQETRVDSPYNTYRNLGLPPGPIGSPGHKALEAALNPAAGNWLYFITVKPDKGITKFTDDYDQFQVWKRQYNRYMQRKRGGE